MLEVSVGWVVSVRLAHSLKLEGRVEVLGPHVPSALSWIVGNTKSGMVDCICYTLCSSLSKTRRNLEWERGAGAKL